MDEQASESAQKTSQAKWTFGEFLAALFPPWLVLIFVLVAIVVVVLMPYLKHVLEVLDGSPSLQRQLM